MISVAHSCLCLLTYFQLSNFYTEIIFVNYVQYYSSIHMPIVYFQLSNLYTQIITYRFTGFFLLIHEGTEFVLLTREGIGFVLLTHDVFCSPMPLFAHLFSFINFLHTDHFCKIVCNIIFLSVYF